MSTSPLTKRIACDECPAVLGDEVIYPHVNQWVDLIPLSTLGEMFLMAEYSRLTVDIAAAEGEAEEMRDINRKMLGVYGDITEMLANRIVKWNWTDAVGRKLGKPSDSKSYSGLTLAEMWWLVRVLQTNGASATEGNGLSSTATTSSDSSLLPDPTNSDTLPSQEAAS